MGFRDGSNRYNPDVNFHINLACNKCGTIEDFDCVSLEEIAPNLKQKTGFEARSHNIEVRGLVHDANNLKQNRIFILWPW